MKKLLSLVVIFAAALGNLCGQQPTNVQKDSTGAITANLAFGTGKVGSFLAGSTLNINGVLSGTPTGGTINLSNVTVLGLTMGAQTIASITGLQAALDAKELTITAGTVAQYWRGDKTWQTLNKAAVGLSAVDNTADASKPVSTATAAALGLKADTATVNTALAGKEPTITAGTITQYWRGDKSWQTLNKTTVGLSAADNTADLNKPVSIATTGALAGKEPTITPGTTSQYWRGDKTWQTLTLPPYPLPLTLGSPLQVLRVNTAGTALEYGTPTGGSGGGGDMFNADNLSTLTNFGTARTNLGLGNVNNTSDASKPVSTATQTALNLKADSSSVPTLPLTVPQGGTGLTALGTPLYNLRVNAAGTLLEYAPPAGGGDMLVANNLSELTATASTARTNLGLGSLSTQNGSFSAVLTSLAGKEPTITATTSADYYRGDKIFVPLTKAAVGLSSVDDTSDASKPVSTATTTALAAKENTITATTTADYFRGDKTFATLNKAAVGLGSVDNTSDASKPTSTATAVSIATKMTNPMTTVGDIVYGGASGTPTRLAVGSNARILTIVSGLPSWAIHTLPTSGSSLSLTGTLAVGSSATSTNPTNGALTVAGGVGIGDTLQVNSLITGWGNIGVSTGGPNQFYGAAGNTAGTATSGGIITVFGHSPNAYGDLSHPPWNGTTFVGASGIIMRGYSESAQYKGSMEFWIENAGVPARGALLDNLGAFTATKLVSNTVVLNAAASTSGGTVIDWALSGSHSRTLSANTTFTFSNDVDGQTIIVKVTNTASNYTVTWPTVNWAGGTTPVETVGAKADIITFTKIGSTIFGVSSQNFTP